jgi:hypothetical protein
MDAITRDLKFFNDKLDQVDKIVYPQDFDDQFNLIGNYLNTVLKPAIDALISGAAAGVVGSDGSFLQNVGDGTTRWQIIDNNAIADYSLTLNKLVKATIGSVLGSNALGNIIPIPPTTNDQVLISQNGTPTWNKLADINITPRAITGRQLGQVTPENFQNNVFTHNVLDNSIDTQHIADNAVTNNKIIDGVVDFKHTGVFYNMVLTQDIKNNIEIPHFAKDAFLPSKIKDGTIDFDKHFYMPPNYNQQAPILAIHIAQGSITDAHLYPYKPSANPMNDQYAGQILTDVDKTFLTVGWKFGEKLTGEHIAKNKLTQLDFSQEVQNAMAHFGI